MKQTTPFIIKFTESDWGEQLPQNLTQNAAQNASQKLSSHLYLPLAFTQRTFFNTKEIKCIRQNAAGNDWYLELHDIEAGKPGLLDILVHEPVLLLVYALKNTTILEKDSIEWSWPFNQYRMVYLTKGRYKWQLNKGHTTSLFIKPPVHLLEVTKHPVITKLLIDFSRKQQTLPDALVNPAVRIALQRLKKIDPVKNQLTAKIFTIFIALLANYDKALSQNGEIIRANYSGAIAVAVQQYLTDNLFEPGIGNLQSLCKQFYISPKTLRKFFVELTGSTVTQWVKNKRLETAWQLVTETKESITSIAYSIGYKEANTFLRDFIARYGQSPTAVRNKK